VIFDLVALLNEKRFSHPSTITAALLANDTLRLTVRGYGWWKDQPAYSNGNAVLSFSGISGGVLDVSSLLDLEDDEALGVFEVSRSEDHDWAQPHTFTLLCSEPIPEPLAIYDLVERWVARSGGIKSVQDFLNGSARLSTYLEYASSQFFMLAEGPESLRAVLSGELVRQGVRHQISPSGGRAEGRYLVRLAEGTWFFCEQATLEPM